MRKRSGYSNSESTGMVQGEANMTETQLRTEGMKVLRESLGLVESERFITLLLREPFDYTAWRETQWNDETIDDIWNIAEKNNF